MGLFDFWKKDKADKLENSSEAGDSKVLLAMPMFNNGETYDLNQVIANLKTDWKLDISEVSGDKNTATFIIGSEIIALAYIEAQIPWGDIQGTAGYAYNWPTAEDDLRNHTGHAIFTLMSSGKSALERFKLLTMVVSAVLATSPAVGVYQGSQTLLIPRDQYLTSADALRKGKLPIQLWLYIGFRKSETGNSLYTYGLTAFGKQEMEIVNSKNELGALYDFLLNICAYTISSNVTLRSGETLGYTAEQKVKITSSKGVFVEGQTLKLEL